MGDRRFWEFFIVNIRNPNTRRAYFKAVNFFAAWYEHRGLENLARVTPKHVAAYGEQLGRDPNAFRLAGNGEDHTGQSSPWGTGTEQSVRKGKTSVFSANEMRKLLAAIDTTTLLGLRDRALIALMGYTFAPFGAATRMKAGEVQVPKRRSWVRLHEEGGTVTELPCHHNPDHRGMPREKLQ